MKNSRSHPTQPATVQKHRTGPDGAPMPKNLYNDNRKPPRPDHYRYKRPDGKFRTLNKPYAEAKIIAMRANELALMATPAQGTRPPGSLSYWLAQYLQWQQARAPIKTQRTAWRNLTGALKNFSGLFDHIRPDQLKLSHLQPWWEGLTYDQQHNRRSGLSQFFQWLIAQGVTGHNPFTKNDNSPRLFEKPKPTRKFKRLTIDQFWAIYNTASELDLPHVQIAMAIGLATGLREGDILAMRWSNLIDGRLCITISKSEQQRGEQAASHRSWPLNDHLLLKNVINRARQLALKHRRCPFIVSYKNNCANRASNKEHSHQLAARKLCTDYTRARNHTGLFNNHPTGTAPPFREIRALFIHQGIKHYTLEQVQQDAAHTDKRVTSGYNANHLPSYVDSNVVITREIIDGSF